MSSKKINRQMLSAMAIGISAGIVLFPVTASANEDEGLGSEPVKEDTDNGQETGAAEDAFDDAKDALSDADSAVSDAAGAVEAADDMPGIPEGTYDNALDALDTAGENTREAAELLGEVEAGSVSGIQAEKDDDTEEKSSKAADAYSDVIDMADEVVAAVEEINPDSTSVQEAEKIVSDARDELELAKEKNEEADTTLMEAEASYNRAGLALEELELQQNATQEKLEEAKENLQEAEQVLEDARQSVEDAAQKAADAKEALDTSEIGTLVEAKEELDGMDSSDEAYEGQLNDFSDRLLNFLSVGKEIPEGTELSFGNGSEEYIIGYLKDETGAFVKDENGDYIPVKESISYRTVTYTVDGVTYTKKFENVQDENGEVIIRELNIDAKKQKLVVQEASSEYYSTDGGQTYTEGSATDIYLIDENDKTKGFYAINKNDTPYSEQHKDLSKDDFKVINSDKSITTKYTPFGNAIEKEGELLEGIGASKDQYGIRFDTYQNCKVVEVTYETRVDYGRSISYSEEEVERIAAARAAELNSQVVNTADTQVVYTYSVIGHNNSDGRLGYNINKTTTVTSTKDVLVDQKVYLATKYANYTPAKEQIEKDVDVVTVQRTDLASTKDEAYREAVAEHTEKIVEAENAKKYAEAAQKAYNDALNKVKIAREAVEELSKKLVSDEELDQLRTEHAIALANLEVAQEAKRAAQKAIEKAQDALSVAAGQLDLIRQAEENRDSTVRDVPTVDDIGYMSGDSETDATDSHENTNSSYQDNSIISVAYVENSVDEATTLYRAGNMSPRKMSLLPSGQSLIRSAGESNSDAAKADELADLISTSLKTSMVKAALAMQQNNDKNAAAGENAKGGEHEEVIPDEAAATSETPEAPGNSRNLAMMALIGVGVVSAEEYVRRKKLLKNIFKNS